LTAARHLDSEGSSPAQVDDRYTRSPMTTVGLHFAKIALGWFAYVALIAALTADAFR